MPRPSKRNELIEKAIQVFNDNGFHATGMDMLVQETGISKTSMYKHFKTKEDLILAALEFRDQEFSEWLLRRMKELGTTPRGQLIAMFDALKEWFVVDDFKGCMFIKASSEYQEPDDPIYINSVKHKHEILQELKNLAIKARAKDSDELAHGLFLLMQGAIVTAQMIKGANPAIEAKATAKILLADALGQ